MKDETQQQWLQTAQQFQQTMTDTWTKAFDSFKNMDLGAAGAKLMAPTVKPPQISFSQEKMQALQQQFMKDATELWTNSFKGAHELKDRRFSDPAWAANPIALKLSTFKLAPPTRAPSTSGLPINSVIFSGFTLPPY